MYFLESIPEAIATNCRKCSDKQRVASMHVIHFLIDTEPQAWSRLEAKFDPTGEYRRRYVESKEVKIIPYTTTTEEYK